MEQATNKNCNAATLTNNATRKRKTRISLPLLRLQQIARGELRFVKRSALQQGGGKTRNSKTGWCIFHIRGRKAMQAPTNNRKPLADRRSGPRQQESAAGKLDLKSKPFISGRCRSRANT